MLTRHKGEDEHTLPCRPRLSYGIPRSSGCTIPEGHENVGLCYYLGITDRPCFAAMRFPVGPQCDERQAVAVGKTSGKGIGPTGPT